MAHFGSYSLVSLFHVTSDSQMSVSHVVRTPADQQLGFNKRTGYVTEWGNLPLTYIRSHRSSDLQSAQTATSEDALCKKRSVPCTLTDAQVSHALPLQGDNFGLA